MAAVVSPRPHIRTRSAGHVEAFSRASAAAVTAVALLGGAAGCGPQAQATDVVSDTDRDRAAVLTADPVLANAVTPPVVVPGRVRSERLGWDRTEVRARIYQFHAPAPGAGPEPLAVERELTKAVATLRAGGWTIHWAMCLPPPMVPAAGQTRHRPCGYRSASHAPPGGSG